MSKAVQAKHDLSELNFEEGTSSLYEQALRSKPLFASKAEAAVAASRELEEIAAKHGVSISELLLEAHTTRDSHEHHFRALQLERQLAYCRR